MQHTITKEAYSFDELDNRAKERARDWFREGALDYDWWDCIYDDAATIADILGINLRQKPVKLMNGSTRYDPCIWFSGFSSQGDGACFEGSYSYVKGCKAKIRDHAPQDKELARIANNLTAVQRQHFYRLEANVKHRGHYYHSRCTEIDVFDREDNYRDIGNAEATIAELLRDFMNWIYRQLEQEYEWRMADTQIDDDIRAEKYEFNKDGTTI